MQDARSRPSSQLSRSAASQRIRKLQALHPAFMHQTVMWSLSAAVLHLQAHGVTLGIGNICVIALTATLAAIGAAAIPSAGLVTMLMVLQVRSDLLPLHVVPCCIRRAGSIEG